MTSGGDRTEFITPLIQTEIDRILKVKPRERTSVEHNILIKYKYNHRVKDYMFSLDNNEKIDLIKEVKK